jgi:hypothetical protein
MKPTPSKACEACPARHESEWRWRGAMLLIELRRHDLNFRELQIAELIPTTKAAQ